MKLHHIAFWSKDIEALIEFYRTYFGGEVLFRHESGDFQCVFVKIFSGLTLEIMTRSKLCDAVAEDRVGYSHFSIEVDSKDEVDRLTDYFIAHKIPMKKVKEQYDDGFYESAVLDPDGNIIEIAYVDRLVNNRV